MATIDYADGVDEELTLSQRTDLMDMMGTSTKAWVTGLDQEPKNTGPMLSVTFYATRGRARFTNTATNTWDMHVVSEAPSYKLPDRAESGLTTDLFWRD